MKKIYKSLVSIGMCSLLMFSAVLPVNAENGNSYAIENELDRIVSEYTQRCPQYKEEIEIKVNSFRSSDSYKEYYKDNPIGAIENVYSVLNRYIDYRKNNDSDYLSAGTASPLAAGGDQWGNRYYVNVPLVMQEKDNYCGPACVYMTIEGIKNHMPSYVRSGITNTQDANATAIGMSNEGSLPYPVKDRLTSMLNGKSYMVTSFFFNEDEFIANISDSLRNNGPVVIMIDTTKFLTYQNAGYTATAPHFVVISSVYTERSSGKTTLTIKDPNSWNGGALYGTHVVPSRELYDCMQAMVHME